MSVMRVAQVAEPGGVSRSSNGAARAGPGHVRIAVEASGVCHTDSVFVQTPSRPCGSLS